MLKKLLSSNLICLSLIMYPGFILMSLLTRVLYPLHFESQPLLISELLTHAVIIPRWLIVVFWFGSIILIWFISRELFKKKFILIPTLIYSISPWFSYLTVTGSFYMYLTFWFLVLFYVLLRIRKSNTKWLQSLLIITSLVIASSSFLGFFLLLLITVSLLVFKPINPSRLKTFILSTAAGMIILIILGVNNVSGAKNIYNYSVSFISDPGLNQAVNNFQGESREVGLKSISRLVENKYLYITKYLSLKLLKNIIPETFFTPQEKLLGFSFSPPLYLGLLIPWMYGLYKISQKPKLRLLFLVSLILIIPSFVDKPMVSLNRLVIFAPVLIFICSFGFVELINLEYHRLRNAVLGVILFLILVQGLTTISDIYLREFPRYLRTQTDAYNFNLGKQ